MGPRVDKTRLDAAIHAGAMLRDWIDGNGATVVGAAQRLGMSRTALNRVLAGQWPMTTRLALALERIGWPRARFWMDLQTSHDIARLRLCLDAD